MKISTGTLHKNPRQTSDRLTSKATPPESEQKRGKIVLGMLRGHLQKAKSEQEKVKEIV